MIPTILHNFRVGQHRYIRANPWEYAQLFGYPPPLLPKGESRPQSGEVIQVMMPGELETLVSAYLGELKKTIVEGLSRQRPPDDQEAESRYRIYLEGLLRHAALSDRRQGLLNLFWLAHLKGVRNSLLHHFPSATREHGTRYRIWPMLSGLFQRAQKGAFNSQKPAEKRKFCFNLGRDFNWGLISSILEDPFYLLEEDVRSFDPQGALGSHNVLFQMEGEVFSRVMEVVGEFFEADAAREDSEIVQIFRRRSSDFRSRQDYLTVHGVGDEAHLFDRGVLTYYLSGGPAAEMLGRERKIKRLVRKIGGWNRFVEEAERITVALKRSEYIQFFQESITLIPSSLDEKEIKNMFLEGRLYKFSSKLPVVNDFKKVVILFADIRAFTSTSETAISERELTERLYDVFDPLVHVVTSLGGTVDKFTGDGMMITFGAVRNLPEANLRALRCAVAIQEAVERLSQSGRTAFQMGLSLHSGRVFVASFLVDDRDKETTVIGRQVNLAARISTTHSHWQSNLEEGKEEEVPGDFIRQRERLQSITPSSPGAVSVDGDGNFYNVGVAASDKFLLELKKTVDMEVVSEEGRRGHRFYDQYLKSEVTFYYLDDIHFKGVHGATPIYGISWRRETGVKA